MSFGFKKLINFLRVRRSEPAANAYNKWGQSYDDQPNNLMLALDEELFSRLVPSSIIKGRHVIDIGCGTGRYWHKIISEGPSSLAGYDVSEEMLKKLKEKHPESDVHLLKNCQLAQ